MRNESILVSVTGPDRAGITARLMEIVVKSQYEILDMGQSITHGLLSLGILIGGPEGGGEGDTPILKDLLFAAKEMDVNLDFKMVKTGSMRPAQGNHFVLICVAKESIAPHFLLEISQMLVTFNINILRINNFNAGQHFKSLKITTLTPPNGNSEKMKTQLLQISQRHRTDVAFLNEHVYRRSKRLIVFDMDSTLIQEEVIDEMSKAHGIEDQVANMTELAMNGELDFTESLIYRVSLLKGLEVKKMQGILDTLPLTSGVQEFVDTVKGLGYKVALISGGFTFFADALKEKLGLDYAYANDLEIADGKLTGKLQGELVDAKYKATLLEQIAEKEKIKLDQVVAIGDGANDLPMLARAGLGIAFHAKEMVKRQTENHMSFGPMTTILDFLGIPERDRIK